MTDDRFGLGDFVENVNEISDKILDSLYQALLEEAKVRDVAKTVSPVVFDNAALRASTILLARIIGIMHYSSIGEEMDEDKLDSKSGDIFNEINQALIPILERHVKAIMVRKTKEDE